MVAQGKRRSEMVFIGKDLNIEELIKGFHYCFQ
ncbi:hypothetical protein F3157_06210 [Virgibacillus dakarensis]|nr:GTP-binding protein [Virgibacillus dakarensis]MTW85252.1 hypothetical protein [Virgibacillus dakarensis]